MKTEEQIRKQLETYEPSKKEAEEELISAIREGEYETAFTLFIQLLNGISNKQVAEWVLKDE